MAGLYAGYKVVLFEKDEPKKRREVTGLGTVVLPSQLEFMTFLGMLWLEKAHIHLHMYEASIPDHPYSDRPRSDDGDDPVFRWHRRGRGCACASTLCSLCVPDTDVRCWQKTSSSTSWARRLTPSPRLLPLLMARLGRGFPCTSTTQKRARSSMTLGSMC